MKISNIKQITIKELKSQFDSFSGYLFIGIFLGLSYYFFLQTFFIAGSVSVRGLFELFPWILAVLIPAVTMGSFATEHEKQTVEYLITKPITTLELVLGKILGATKFTFIAVLLTLPLPIFISFMGNLDWGEVFAGYLGTLFLIFTYSSIGVAISSFFKNQISAFVTTVLLLILLNIVGSDFTTINMPINIATILASFSITEHYFSMVRGVLDLDDVLYFVLLSLISISITYISIKNIRYGKVKSSLNSGLVAILVTAILGVLIYYSLGVVNTRIDLTSAKKYTLSQVTVDTLQRDGKAIVKVYASPEMPYEFQYRLNELTNILDDYKKQGQDKIEIQYLDPKENEQDLISEGIPPAEFRNYSEDQFQVQQGYLAVIIESEDGAKKEIIPFVENVDTLEYDLSSAIYKVKTDDKNVIGFASGNGERSIYEDYQLLNSVLGADHELQNVYLPGEEPAFLDEEGNPIVVEEGSPELQIGEEAEPQPDLSGFKLLVIANPLNQYTQASQGNIDQFIQNGGNVIYLVDMLDVSPDLGQNSQAIANPDRGQLFAKYGISLNPDMIYDTRSHMTINIPVGNISLPYPYPLLPIIGLVEEPEIPNMPTTVLSGWASTMNISDENWTSLFTTSPYAAIKTGFDISPRQAFDSSNTDTYPMIITRKLDNGSILVVSNTARIFDNQFIQGSRENVILAASMFDFLSQGSGFSEIKAKKITSSRFIMVSSIDKNLIKYGAPALSFLLLFGIGTSRYIRRRKLIRQYS